MSRSRRKKGNQNISYWAMILSVAFLALIFMYVYIKAVSEQVEIDKASNCRTDGKSPRDTVLLLDATEVYSDSHLEALRNIVNKYVDSALIHERFTVYVLGDEPDRYEPQLVVCNPGNGDGVSPITGAPEKMFRAWTKSFKEPIIEIVNTLDAQLSAQTSPVMEMLKFVGLRTIARKTSVEKRIIMVSDMVENTESYSQYAQTNMKYFDWRDNPHFRQTRSQLNNVDVHIIYVERPTLSHIQGRNHIEKFWRPLIDNAGGALKSIKTIN